MAERVGFEPTLPFRVNTLSKRAPSATRPSLRRGSNWEIGLSGVLATVRDADACLRFGLHSILWVKAVGCNLAAQIRLGVRRVFQDTLNLFRALQGLKLKMKLKSPWEPNLKLTLLPQPRWRFHWSGPSAALALSYCRPHDGSDSRARVPGDRRRRAYRRLCADNF